MPNAYAYNGQPFFITPDGTMDYAYLGQPYAGSMGATSISLTLTGAGITSSSQSLQAYMDTVVSGLSISGSQETLLPELAASIFGLLSAMATGATIPLTEMSISGESVSMYAGLLTPNSALILNGIDFSGVLNSLSIEQVLNLAGLSQAADTGTLTPEITYSITLDLSGLQISSSTGLLSPEYNVSMAGASSSVSQNSVALSVVKSLLGDQLASATGDLTPTITQLITLSLDGQLSTAQQGLLTASVALALNGGLQSFSLGSMIVPVDAASIQWVIFKPGLKSVLVSDSSDQLIVSSLVKTLAVRG